jgi:hypothetical protein
MYAYVCSSVYVVVVVVKTRKMKKMIEDGEIRRRWSFLWYVFLKLLACIICASKHVCLKSINVTLFEF